MFPVAGDRRQPEDLYSLLEKQEKHHAAELLRAKAELLVTLQGHDLEHTSAHTRLRTEFRDQEERQNSFARELREQQMKFATFAATPINAAALQLTTLQIIGVVTVTLLFATAQVTQLVRGEMQIMLQNERAATLTAAIKEVKAAQAMSELNRVNDVADLRRLIEDQRKLITTPKKD